MYHYKAFLKVIVGYNLSGKPAVHVSMVGYIVYLVPHGEKQLLQYKLNYIFKLVY